MTRTKTSTQWLSENLGALPNQPKSVRLLRVTDAKAGVPDQPGVYLIWCVKSGRFYVGSSERSLRGRLKRHLRELQTSKHHNRDMRLDCLKYGIESFRVVVLELCDKRGARRAEQRYIDAWRACELGYNKAQLACGGGERYKTPETRQKISQHRKAYWAAADKTAQRARFKALRNSPTVKAKLAAYTTSPAYGASVAARYAAQRDPVPFSLQYQNGESFEGENLFGFLKARNLQRHYFHFKDLQKGKRRSLLGWHLPDKPLTEYKFKNASGESFSTFNLKAFSKKYNLNYICMLHVHDGSFKQHKGFHRSDKTIPVYRFTSPAGALFRCSQLTPFAREHGLDAGLLLQVQRGKYKQHKGWTKA